MRIAVVSDTHYNTNVLDNILSEVKDFDMIFHLGDNVKDALYLAKNFHGEVHYVKGNCDIGVAAPDDKIVEVEGKRFFLTHGHNYGVKYNLNNLYFKARELDVDVALYGHSHIKQIERVENLDIMNPGSASLPRDGSRSIGLIEIKNDNINIKIRNL
ncbi:metallophosphoesterase [Clostridium sp.]|uniref:metallophosphoesterase n=1 Tax=Clostridium sp. TaxID=1506 RepID=UPI0039941A3B